MNGATTGPDLAQQADAILARYRGVASTAAIAEMQTGIAAWLAARPATAPPTDLQPDAQNARRLLMEAMDRVHQGRGIG